MGGMFSRPSAPPPQPVPAAPAPIDYDRMANASIRVAREQIAAEEAAVKRLYPEYIRMQFGTADQLAGRLDNDYLARTRGVLGEELQAASAANAIERQLQQRALGDLQRGPTAIQRQLQADGQRELAIGQTAIESRLLSDAQRELGLGRSLSAEEQRDATQSARQAFAARGMATGNAAASAELLNRDAFGRQREAERRQFAMGAEQYARAGLMDRRGFAQAAEQYGVGMEEQRRAQALGANQLDLARRQRRIGLAGAYGDLDPFRQGMGPAFNLGMNTLGNTTSQVSNVFGNSLQQSGNVASFNTNMAASNRNAILNNNAALQAANMQAGAMQNAGMMNMIGGIGQGVGMAATIPFMFSDKRMKKDIKPLGKAGNVLGLKAYEFKYKGDDKKHVGFMAQDVQKVLPEAVTEVEHQGKKRLAIKPAVIGAALAQELMTAKAA